MEIKVLQRKMKRRLCVHHNVILGSTCITVVLYLSIGWKGL